MNGFRRVIDALRRLASGSGEGQVSGGPGSEAEDRALRRLIRLARISDWGLTLREEDEIDIDAPLLAREHEGRLIAEYGHEALYRYYTTSPNWDKDVVLGTATADIGAGESGWVKR